MRESTAGRRSILAAICAWAMLSSGCTALTAEPEPETVRIAADLELSGDYSHIGAIYRNALELRVEQVNQQQLLGDSRRMDLVVRDNRSDPAVSAANLRDFANDPSVAAIVSGACWQCLESGLDNITAQGVPTISLAAPDAVVEPLEDRRYVFKLGPNAADVATAILAELPDDVRTVAAVATDDLYGTDGMNELSNLASDAGVEIVISELLSPGGGGISSAAQAIANFRPETAPGTFVNTGEPGPDAVIAWGYDPFGAELAAALRGAGYQGPLFLDPGAADDLFLSGTSAQALRGATMIFTETLVIDEVVATSPAKANRTNWFNDYTARHGTYHAFSSFAADAIEIVVRSINTIGTGDRETLRNALESVQMDGITGPIRMSPQHHSGLMASALTPLLARDDRWRLAG